ncbi:MAG: hypothetical protein R1F52_04560 [Candidatus Nitrosoabyssus spongiisocia]|nr:MAG: hypothetical protein R1F52_04560 [Nitrosopumilaceae archaeon AB1(1)]
MTCSAYLDIFTLEGEDLKNFLEYDQRKLSAKEKAILKEAVEFYQEQYKKNLVYESQ